MYKAKELKEALSQHPYEDIVNLLVKAYRLSPDVQREVDHFLRGENYTDDKLNVLIAYINNLPQHSAGTFKSLISEYMKVEKDKKKRIDLIFHFVEAALVAYGKGQCDHRMIMYASSIYGKAVKMMNQKLWNWYLEQAYSIAGAFYETGLEAGVQAVLYYREVKGKFEKE